MNAALGQPAPLGKRPTSTGRPTWRPTGPAPRLTIPGASRISAPRETKSTETNRMIVALIVAAGRGSRMAGPTPKQYRPLGGAAVLRHTVLAFHHHPAIALTQVVIHPEDAPLYAEATAGLDLPPAVFGGATRQESVRRGIEAVAARAPDHILIHDAVRPFVAAETITAVIAALARHRAVIAGLPVVDTLKRCAGEIVTATLDRAGVWRAQTPQGFRFPDILAAHRAADGALGAGAADLTDDSLVAERAGIPVAMVLGHEDAFKITTEPDLARAEAILQRRLAASDLAGGAAGED